MTVIQSIPVPDADRECGLLTYSTSGGGMEGSLRGSFDDFQVEEIISLEEVSEAKAPGLVPVYKVEKVGIDTPHVAREIAAQIRSEVNFAGLKDKNATVIQYMSARSSRASAPSEIRGSRFRATLFGFSRPITRAMLLGNRFGILIETSASMRADIEEVFLACRERRVGNFFGYQRFGTRGGVNRKVGKALVSKDFALATSLLLAEPREGEGEMVREARRLCREGSFGQALAVFPPRQDLERKVASHLAQRPGDSLGALRRLPIPIRRLLVNAYQAYLFNLTLSRILEQGPVLARARIGDNWASLGEDGLTVGRVHGVREAPEGSSPIPLIQIVGYAYRDYGSRFDAMLAKVLEEEGVSPKSFYIKEAEEMSSEGGFRPAPILSRELSFRKVENGFALEFSLAKGEYATVLLRELLKPSDPSEAGF